MSYRTSVAPRKRPQHVDRFPRLSVEIHPGEEDLIHRAKIAAVVGRVTLRDWFIEAIRQRLDRESAHDR